MDDPPPERSFAASSPSHAPAALGRDNFTQITGFGRALPVRNLLFGCLPSPNFGVGAGVEAHFLLTHAENEIRGVLCLGQQKLFLVFLPV